MELEFLVKQIENESKLYGVTLSISLHSLISKQEFEEKSWIITKILEPKSKQLDCVAQSMAELRLTRQQWTVKHPRYLENNP